MQADELFDAIRTGDRAAAQALLDEDTTLAAARDDSGVTPLLQALYQRKPELVEVVLRARRELDPFEAAAVGDIERLAALLDADPRVARARAADGFTPLHLACYFGSEPAVALLIERGADVAAVAENAMRVQPIHCAASSGVLECAAALLRAGADVNAKQHGGWTALHAAAKDGRFELAERLIEHGADRSAETEDGKTPSDLSGSDRVAALLRDG